MSIKNLQNYTYYAKYARYLEKEKRRETWNEAIDRVVDMHLRRYPQVKEEIEWIRPLMKEKRFLGSQRALQYGGEPIEKKNSRIFNCIAGYCDRLRFFQETFWLLLAGCGVGFSVQKHHVAKLPNFNEHAKYLRNHEKTVNKIYTIPDTIEGWADALGVLLSTYFDFNDFKEYKGYRVSFDYSLIRPEGSLLSSGVGKAPGPEPLRNALEKIRILLDDCITRGFKRLRPIDAYDIVMHASDAVLSGGVRRCIAKGQKVLTKNGSYKNIEDIIVGDLVLTENGWKKVKNTFIQGKQKTIKIKHSQGEMICTPNHRIAILCNIFGEFIWKKAKDITSDDRLFFCRPTSLHGENKFPYFKYINPKHSTTCKNISIPELDEDMAWFVGVFQGDGYVRLTEKSGEITVAVHKKDIDQVKLIENCIKRFGVNVYIQQPNENDKSFKIRCKSKQLAEFLYKYVKQPKMCLKIPEFIKNATGEIRAAYLKGVMDADGSVKTRPQQIVVSIYKDWVQELQNLMYSIGIVTYQKNIFVKNKNWQKKYSLVIANNDDIELFCNLGKEYNKKLSIRKYNKSNNSFSPEMVGHISNYKLRRYNCNYTTAVVSQLGGNKNIVPIKVNSVEQFEELETFDIEVEENHSFICEGVLVHNSATLCMFSHDDEEMIKAKTGNWFYENPQRGRSNNSALLIRNKTTREEFLSLIESVKQYGEPGFIWSDDTECLFNPCVEISLYGYDEKGNSGFQACVSGDTKLITKEGVCFIEDVVDKEIEIWNGKSWKKVKPFVTGFNRELYRVSFSDGSYLDCTENHKFLISDRFSDYQEVTTLNLLSHSNYKVHVPRANIDYSNCGGIHEEYAYEYGFVLGDGSAKKNSFPFANLMDKKIDLPLRGERGEIKKSEKYNCPFQFLYFNTLDKEFSFELKKIDQLPDKIFSWNYDSIIKFISGWADADGSMANNGCRIYSTEQRIRDLQLLLTKVGINSSVNLMSKKGSKTNYGTRNRDIWYVQIPNASKLKTNRLKFIDKISRQSKNKHQIIMSVEKLEGLHTSYCLEETELHQCVFNNVLTKQCNLCEINGKKIKSIDDFRIAAKGAAILGTLQAGYTDFEYLGPVSENIIRKEALLGVSITGMMDSPEILFNPDIQREMAELIKTTNKEIAAKIGINPAARTTCVKPAGSTSCVLGTASGIHPHHAKRYFRRVQANQLEPVLQHFKKFNPIAIEKSVWSANKTDDVITFCIEVPAGAKTKNDLSAIDLLNYVKLTQQNWVTAGKDSSLCVKPWLNHNVSNTVNVKENEWNDVANYIYDNRESFAGISLLPASGDLDYPQAPMANVLNHKEIINEYGEGALLASGLIVDGLHVFDNLWEACDVALGRGIPLEEPTDKTEHEVWHKKSNWVRRVKQFADRYCEQDLVKCTRLLKHVHNWKMWLDLNREYKDVDYSSFYEDTNNVKLNETVACAGGTCELVF